MKRHRSKSNVMERNVEADATLVDGVDLSLYMSPKTIVSLGDADKEQLRNIVRTHEIQNHFRRMNSGFAASGARLLIIPTKEARKRDNDKANLYDDLVYHANPLPEAQEYIDGIHHKSSNEDVRGLLLNVPQAVHTYKMHYYTLLKKEIENALRSRN